MKSALSVKPVLHRLLLKFRLALCTHQVGSGPFDSFILLFPHSLGARLPI
jgi:hypothetical protein